MIGFIKKLLKQNLDPLKSEQMQAFSVEADYEKDFPNYYKEHLEPYFKEYFSQKFKTL
ncbi:hypothetical protein NOVO_01095 [Rickettsiales bacterium Ac37b]|nr:hypothetical protein NOVO_01095 [Rickettsiales bacterium Ac37b]